MKSLSIIFGSILVLLACFAFAPATKAVVPPPDGGYRGQNTAEGDQALFGLTTGFNNTAIGFHALYSNTIGSNNVATGHNALVGNTTGFNNTATGGGALFGNTTGFANTATGNGALNFNTTGNNNTATGRIALLLNTTGNDNTAMGASALLSNTIGYQNTATGVAALAHNTSGIVNTATGVEALYSNTTGIGNTASGVNALAFNTTGQSNTADGLEALFSNASGNENTATGVDALTFNTGDGNTAAGFQALLNNTTGGSNIALGYNAGANLTTGNNNIEIGNQGVAAESGTIRIGTDTVQTMAFVAGVRGVTTANSDAVPVVIDSAGQLGTVSSSRRCKHDIKPMGEASETLLALKPVTFHYKSDKTNTPQFGLIAEEVANVNPDLVVRDKDGEIYTVRYDAVNAMLLNEFLKQHNKVEQQAREIREQKETISVLKRVTDSVFAELKEQASQIQKVNAQLELSKGATRTVVEKE